MKPFFDVFPTLEVRGDLRDYFKETQIERLTTNHAHTRIKVCLHSGHLIHKGRVLRMQQEIARQIFPQREVEVYIDEHYNLSAQYTPRRLMQEYCDSISTEIESFSHVMGKYFREAQMSYPDEQSIRIVIEESCLSRSLYSKLEEALNRIFRERCGVQANLTVELRSSGRERNGSRPARPAQLTGADAAFHVQYSSGNDAGPDDAFMMQYGGGQPQYAAQGADTYPSQNARSDHRADMPGGACICIEGLQEYQSCLVT